MTIIVFGKIYVASGQRDRFIEKSIESIALARSTDGCLDFSVSPDPIDVNRVNIFEKWMSQEVLEAFRQSGPEDELFSLIESAEVSEHELAE
jgi:quinol monooxygenase YgiN